MARKPKRRLARPLSQLVGERIQALRDEQDLSRTELARRADISLTNLNLIEQGRVQPRLQTLGTIASTLGVRAADLLDEEPLPPRPKPASATYRRLAAHLQEHQGDEDYLKALEKIVKALDQVIDAKG